MTEFSGGDRVGVLGRTGASARGRVLPQHDRASLHQPGHHRTGPAQAAEERRSGHHRCHVAQCPAAEGVAQVRVLLPDALASSPSRSPTRARSCTRDGRTDSWTPARSHGRVPRGQAASGPPGGGPFLEAYSVLADELEKYDPGAVDRRGRTGRPLPGAGPAALAAAKTAHARVDLAGLLPQRLQVGRQPAPDRPGGTGPRPPPGSIRRGVARRWCAGPTTSACLRWSQGSR